MSGTAPERETLAAEYALGVLEPYEARAVEAVAARDPAVAADIRWWEDRLAPLADLVPGARPPPSLWLRLELATGLRAARPNRPRPQGVGLWRSATFVTTAIAASLAAFIVLRPPAAPIQYVAALGPMGGPASAFVAQVRADGTVLLTPVSPSAVPADHDLELWALMAGAQRPVSLGVLPAAGRSVSPAIAPNDHTQLLVSLEPRGGSPTGQPTGPVLYAGTVARAQSGNQSGK